MGIENPMVWFDLDDTIWDMSGNSTIALTEIYNTNRIVSSAFGASGLQGWLDCYHSINRKLWEKYDNKEIGRSTLRLERFAQPLICAGMNRKEAEKLSRELDGEYLQLLGDCPGLIDGATQAIAAIQARGLRTGIVSNGFREVQYRKLQSGGLNGLFSPIILSDDVGCNKPDSEFFRHAEQTAQTDPAHCIIIGDNARSDIAGAIDAGWGGAIWLAATSTPIPECLRKRPGRWLRIHHMADLAKIR